MLGGIGVQEILVILVVGLLVFGASRLPKIARSLGLGIKEFKKTVKGIEEDDSEETPKVNYSQGSNQNNPPQQEQYNQQYNQWQGTQQASQGPNMYQNPQQQPPAGGTNPYQASQQPYNSNKSQAEAVQSQSPYGNQSSQAQQQQGSEFDQGQQGQPPKPGV
ncbi:MAG: hypothetical protein DRP84_00515 [Spirochaetes bacterium]|nr:MAG: hypothetical protein DRP84_00515 [Spirochaetota bacterium]